MKYCGHLLGNGKKERRKDIPVPIRIGDSTHTVRIHPKITTDRRSGTLLVGGLALVRFYDTFGTSFGGIYRVVEERPCYHDGNFKTYVLEKTVQ